MQITDVERVMHEMPYGLYIIGSKEADGRVNGMMADWVMQVSFQPRLVAVAFEQNSHTLSNIRERRYFSVNLLAQDDESMELARVFAQPFSGEKVEGPPGEERESCTTNSRASRQTLRQRLPGEQLSRLTLAAHPRRPVQELRTEIDAASETPV